MTDFNFFSQYIKQEKHSKGKMLILGAVLFLLIAATAAVYIFFSSTTSAVERDINEMEKFLKAEDTLQKLDDIRKKKQEFDLLDKYYNSVSAVEADISEANIIKSSLIETINTALPGGVSFRVVSFSSNRIQIQGEAESRTKIAELLHNMKDLDIFADVHAPSLQGSGEESFNFVIQCVLKDVIVE